LVQDNFRILIAEKRKQKNSKYRMSLPYSFQTEYFNNVPCGSNLGFMFPSTCVNSYQNTQKNGNNAIYVNKSTMDAYYISQYGSNTGIRNQYKSQQERIAALLGKLSVQCGQY